MWYLHAFALNLLACAVVAFISGMWGLSGRFREVEARLMDTEDTLARVEDVVLSLAEDIAEKNRRSKNE